MSPFKSYPVCKDAGVNGWEALPLSKQACTDRIKQMIEGVSA